MGKSALPVVDRRCTFREHCRDKGEYRMRGGCYNCGAELIGIFTRGHEAGGGDCPVCGCSRLHWDRLDGTGVPNGGK